jgi:hypothetical protein
MHRRTTKLSQRTARLTDRVGFGSRLVRPAKALEYRGVIATYTLQDRALGNRRARRSFQQKPLALDDVQQKVLAELDEQDYAVVPFAELVPDDAIRTGIEREGAEFIDATEKELASETRDVRDVYKDYLVRRYGRRDEEIPLDAPWLACCLSDRMLGLANAYLRMWSKLEYLDFWYSVPVSADSERIQSQRWHRDFDDRHLLKAFLYLVDVDEGTGPFEFVSGSARRGAAAGFWPWHPGSNTYPSQADFDRNVPAEDIRTFTAPAGTLVLCNTSGFHRGGFATARPRVLATATYCSPASLKSLTERNYRLPQGETKTLSGRQHYAVS